MEGNDYSGSNEKGAGADFEAEAEQAFQEWLDKVQQQEPPDTDHFLGSFPAEVQKVLRQKLDEYHEIAGRLGGLGGGLTAGRRLGDFRLVKELGRGGTGIVWEAEQVSMNRRVALKLLYPIYALSPGVLERFRREAEAAGRLAHPGIVRVFTTGEEEGLHFIAQELIPNGRTLIEAMQDRWDSEGEEAYFQWMGRVFSRIAEAVHTAHRAGVVHRDLKPGNILMAGDVPLVGDFGLAHLDGRLSQSMSHSSVGTPYYMSPEQIHGKSNAIGFQTDIFSLGATLYEGLSGLPPFPGENRQAIAKRILDEDPLWPRILRSGVPFDLELICFRAMEKRKEDRYSTMAAFQRDLEAWLVGDPISVRGPTKTQIAFRWIRRHPAISTGLSITTLLTISLFALLLVGRESTLHMTRALRISEHLLQILNPDHAGAQASLEHLKGAQRLIERTLNGDPVLQARLLFSVGRAYRYLEFWDQALPSLEAGIALLEGKPSSALLLDIKLERGWCLQRSNKGPEVRKILEDVIANSSTLSPKGRLRINRARNRLGAYWIDNGEFERALDVFVEVEKGLAEIGMEESPLALLNQLDIAIALDHLKYFAEAEVILIKTIKDYEKSLGRFHPEIPYCYQALQHALLTQGKVAKGIAAGETAKSRAEQIFGLTHQTTMDIYTAVARTRIEAQESDVDMSEPLH